jgi:hypothetical protein
MNGTFAPKATDTIANKSDPTRIDDIKVATEMKSIKNNASGKKLQKPRRKKSIAQKFLLEARVTR